MNYSLEIEALVSHKHKLEAEVERLRAVLQNIADNSDDEWAFKEARAALDEGLPTADDVRGIMREQKP